MNRIIIDLHCHSTISDGILSPSDLVKYAHKKNVKVLALTDHDDISGLKDARNESIQKNIIFINGVEISVTWRKRTIHIVGLNFDDKNENLKKQLKLIRDGRENRAIKMSEELGNVGIKNALKGARNYSKSGSLGRIHFAQYLVETGLAKNVKSVFKKYLTEGKPGYVNHTWAPIKDAVRWINDAGGIAVIAHPGRYDMGSKLYPELFKEFKDYGGGGVEIMSGSQDPSQLNYFANLSNQFGLLSSCGSDFHGPGISFRDMGKLYSFPKECTPIWSSWNQLNEINH